MACLNFCFLQETEKLLQQTVQKRKQEAFLVILIRRKYVTIKHSGKLFSLFFLKMKVTNRIALVDEDETVISDD